MNDPIDNFIDAMRAEGLNPPDHILPDEFMRFPGVGKKNGNTDGYCKLFADGTGGVFGDWSTGLKGFWQAESDKPLSEQEKKNTARQE
jgi:putative DNA primase/helicase